MNSQNETSTEQNETYSISDIAKITGKSSTSIYRYVKTGKLPSFAMTQHGKEVFRVKKEDLDRFLASTNLNIKHFDTTKSHLDTSTLQDEKTPVASTLQNDTSVIEGAISRGIEKALTDREARLMKPLEEMTLYRLGMAQNEISHLQNEKTLLQEENENLRKLLQEKEKEILCIVETWKEKVEDLEKPWWKKIF